MPASLPVLPQDRPLAHHMLVLPAGADRDAVDALAMSRYPDDVTRLDSDSLALPGGAGLTGPWVLPPPWQDQFPGGATVYLLDVGRERGGAVPTELRGRGGLLDAFADGEPIGVERETLELALAIARRLGGVVRTRGADGVVLTPTAMPDLIVYSEVWLHPDALVHVVQPALPGIAIESDAPRVPLPDDAAIGLRSLIHDDSERRWLHAEADAYDANTLSQPVVTEAYGAMVRDDDGAVFSVSVEAALGIPAILGGRGMTGVICYEVRCHPAPDARIPANAVDRIDATAAALLAAIGGAVVDDDGFEVTDL